MTITRAQTRAALVESIEQIQAREIELLREALDEIVASNLGDCPASMDERDFARGHNHRVRMIARDALKKLSAPKTHSSRTVCDFCGTWRSRSCGEGCHWGICQPNGPGHGFAPKDEAAQ